LSGLRVLSELCDRRRSSPGRRLIRANAMPLDWPSQRAMFGFA